MRGPTVHNFSFLDFRLVQCPETLGATCVALPYLNGLPTRIPPRSFMVCRHTMHFLSFRRIRAPRLPCNTSLEYRLMWRYERGRKKGNGRKSGAILIGSSLDRCATQPSAA